MTLVCNNTVRNLELKGSTANPSNCQSIQSCHYNNLNHRYINRIAIPISLVVYLLQCYIGFVDWLQNLCTIENQCLLALYTVEISMLQQRKHIVYVSGPISVNYIRLGQLLQVEVRIN